MPTSVHIPKVLLDEVDDRARHLGLSRNRLIVRTLEKEFQRAAWPAGFFDQFRTAGPGLARTIGAMEKAIARSRRSKKAPNL
jgi:hypothetical protein